jgi:hypothetical protein
MFQHFLRYVREENWFLFFKHLRRRANARNLRTNLDRRRVRFLIECQNLQTFSATVQDVEVGSMEVTSAGQNATQAVQDGFYRGLTGHRAGRIQQSSISIFGAPHVLCALMPSALMRRPYQTTPSVFSFKSGARAEFLAQAS